MNIFTKLLLISILLIGCAEKDDATPTKISSGTSFGECFGYCLREIEISSDRLVYFASSWDTVNYPTLDTSAVITSTEWNDLLALVDLSVMQSYEDVIGCPDCADGGAEWIKVESPEESKQITFEYGDSLESIQPLIEQLRLLRAENEVLVFAEDSPSQKIEIGSFSGEYKVFHNYGTAEERWSSGITALTIDENGYHLTENTYITPPFSGGRCDWSETTIYFQDTVIHTAEFDWTLIIDDSYDYTYDGSILELSQVDPDYNRKYTYNLTKD